jgi:hypothetical protein
MITCQICETTLRDYEHPETGDPIACFDCLTDYELPLMLGLIEVERYGEKLSTAR